MRICFDGIGISHLKNTGLYSYTYELLNGLTRLYPQPEYTIVTNKGTTSNSLTNDKVDYVEMYLNRRKNDYSLLEKYLEEKKIDIFHSPNNGFSLPNNKVCKYILTLHNLLPISSPQYVDSKYNKKFKTVIPNALEKADKIIAVSEFIKKELHKYYKISDEKVVVIHPTLSKIFRPIDKEKSSLILKNKYNLHGNFLLFCGSIHMRKHINIIMTVFKKILNQHEDLKLVIVGTYKGKRQLYYLKLKEYANKIDIEDNIIFTGSVEYEDMPYFYNASSCAINISDYEGFPMSSVEALACGTPLICSNSSSFKEVLGTAPLYVDYSDVDNFKDVILEIIQNNKGGNIKNSINEMLKYKSETSIKKLVRVYESVV